MRAFLSPSIPFTKSFALLLTAVSPFILTACKDDKSEKESTTQEIKSEGAAAQKGPKPSTTDKVLSSTSNGENLKIGQETDEPALQTLMKLDSKLVVARVEGEEITVGQLIDVINASPNQIKGLPLTKVYVSLAKRLRDMRALVKAAAKAGVDNLPDVKKKVEEASEAVRVKHFVDEKIDAQITPEYLKKQFDEFMKIYMKDGKSQKEFRLTVAIVSSKKDAEALIARSKKGDKFEDLVVELSTDPKVKETKGELGYVRFSELPEELAKKIQMSATGVVVDFPAELGKDKWAVFKKLDQRDVPPPTFEEVAPDLKKVVMPQFFDKVLGDVLKTMKSEIIDYKTGQPLDEKALEEKKVDQPAIMPNGDSSEPKGGTTDKAPAKNNSTKAEKKVPAKS